MKAAGIDYAALGLESGSERVRKELLDKHFTNERYMEVCHLAAKNGVELRVYVLVGIPGETEADFEETKAMLRTSKPSVMASYIVFPYPGTRIHERAMAEGYIKEMPSLDGERARAVMDSKLFPARRVENEWQWLEYRVMNWGLPARLGMVLYKKACTRGALGLKWY
jgi:radical SAM superfamily enzyme YgiQ (UPF0313 family)